MDRALMRAARRSVWICPGCRRIGARLEAVFDGTQRPDSWTRQVLEAGAHVAALLLELERAQGWRLVRASRDGAAPLIGSSAAIQQVRDRIERVAAIDFTALVEGASGPQPHPDFIEL
jgi:DNA-binding NtrC family response regulator